MLVLWVFDFILMIMIKQLFLVIMKKLKVMLDVLNIKQIMSWQVYEIEIDLLKWCWRNFLYFILLKLQVNGVELFIMNNSWFVVSVVNFDIYENIV